MTRLREIELDALEGVHVDGDGERREDGGDIRIVAEDLLDPAHASGNQLSPHTVLVGNGLPKKRPKDVRLVRAQDGEPSIHKEAGHPLVVVMIHERES